MRSRNVAQQHCKAKETTRHVVVQSQNCSEVSSETCEQIIKIPQRLPKSKTHQFIEQKMVPHISTLYESLWHPKLRRMFIVSRKLSVLKRSRISALVLQYFFSLHYSAGQVHGNNEQVQAIQWPASSKWTGCSQHWPSSLEVVSGVRA